MIAAPNIVTATEADVESLARLRVELGWNRSDPLLHGALNWEGGRIFVVRVGSVTEAQGELAQAPAATTTAIAAGPVGVIGNVAVRPDCQRRGLGQLVTAHAVEWQRAQGVRNVWLDATPAGRPLYRRLGFTDVAPSWVIFTPLRDLRIDRLTALAGGMTAELATPHALTSIASLDLAAFGGDRMGLLRALADQDGYRLFVARDPGGDPDHPLGYAFTHPIQAPLRGARIGPLIATSHAAAAALTLAAVQAERQRQPEDFATGGAYLTASGGGSSTARAFFDEIGATTVDDDLVMRLNLAGDDGLAQNRDIPARRTEGRPSVYSWIAPMLF
ncbi:MAG TPA: GNAT family N-acetyltransferase [Ktedonobacterales bacterium]|nr:GNAT family N-acetyltransferase [Ktedonobacterales bacterium]